MCFISTVYEFSVSLSFHVYMLKEGKIKEICLKDLDLNLGFQVKTLLQRQHIYNVSSLNRQDHLYSETIFTSTGKDTWE